MDELIICPDCDICHYINCDACYGFGVYNGGGIVRAIDINYPKGEVIRCPQCDSSAGGIPKIKDPG